MIWRRKKLSIYLAIFGIVFGASAAVFTPTVHRARHVAAEETQRATDAAFRDGVFLGKLHAAAGGKPHPTASRWNTPKDHASFVAGYLQGYRQMQDAKSARRVHWAPPAPPAETAPNH